ncbi:hypothetical protein GGU11DRAFT_756123 [Lentinula aff. detonsa]|nr:hypothetical protein GGU11DRAFT_756123 [Lentinula aff. detonsa]
MYSPYLARGNLTSTSSLSEAFGTHSPSGTGNRHPSTSRIPSCLAPVAPQTPSPHAPRPAQRLDGQLLTSQLPSTFPRSQFRGSPPVLLPSTAQNIQDGRRAASSMSRTDSQSRSVSHHRNENLRGRSGAQRVSTDLTWESVQVHHPVDAFRLREDTLYASAKAASAPTSLKSPTAVDSSFLAQNPPQSTANSRLASLLNTPLPLTTPSPGLPPQLSPILIPNRNTVSTPATPANPTVSRTLQTIRAPPPHCLDEYSARSRASEEPASGSAVEGRPSPPPVPVVCPRMGTGEKELKKKTKNLALRNAVESLADYIDREIQRIGAEHKRSLLTVKKLMGVHRRFREKRKGSLYNAIMHKKAQELSLQSRQLKLAELHNAIAADEDLQDILNNPDGEEAQEALDELIEYQLAKFQGSRASAKANDNDIVKTWGGISYNAQNLSKRTSAATFGFVCSSKPGQNVTRQFFGNGPIEGFLMSKFGMSGADFVEAAEAYFILTASGRTANGASIKKMQKDITRLVRDGLRDLTGNPKLCMEWEHYEVLIVKQWGVKLEGWPEGVKMVTATSLHAAEVISVYQALHSRRCRWRRLDGKELYTVKKDIDSRIKRGDLVVPERRRGKKRSAEGSLEGSQKKKRARLGKKTGGVGKKNINGGRPKQLAGSDSDVAWSIGLEEELEEEGEEVQPPVERVGERGRPKPKPLAWSKRKVVLSDEEDDDEEDHEQEGKDKGKGKEVDINREEEEDMEEEEELAENDEINLPWEVDFDMDDMDQFLGFDMEGVDELDSDV